MSKGKFVFGLASICILLILCISFIDCMAVVAWFPLRRLISLDLFTKWFYSGVMLLVTARLVCYGLEYLGRRYLTFEEDKKAAEAKKLLQDYIKAKETEKEVQEVVDSTTTSSGTPRESRTAKSISSSNPRAEWGQIRH